MIKILHINTSDTGGGAAIAAYRLHKELASQMLDSSMLTAQKKTIDPNIVVFKPNSSFFMRFKRALRAIWIEYEFSKYKKSRPLDLEVFSDDRTQFGREIVHQTSVCDIIHLHWISGFIDYQSFFANVRHLPPIVWTLHDMNAFTGGCHYNLGCNKYMNGCGACPQLGSDNPDDLSHRTWMRKKRVFEQLKQRDIHFVAPSNWLTEKALETNMLIKFKISTIPNGLNTEAFAPRNRQQARETLGIPLDAKVILFIAHSVQKKRKGFEVLKRTLTNWDEIEKLFIITVGRYNSPLNLKTPTLHLGYIENERLMSLVYSAADIFVIPSLQDNLPNTVLESIACGTPVVGFNVGGISEMIRDGITGVLVPTQDHIALKKAIMDILENSEKRAEMSINCRRIAVNEYSIQNISRTYVNIYKQIARV